MDLNKRAFYGGWLALATVACTYFGGLPFTILLTLVSTLASLEWLQLCAHPLVSEWKWSGLAVLHIFSQCIAAMRTQGTSPLMQLFLIVWSTDTGAYAFGQVIGGPRLWISLSPNKTVAGLAGGVAIGVAAGACCGCEVFSSLLISVAAQGGDLLESFVKRVAGVKDTNLVGWLIPGHGGVLDRIDALLLATPVAYMVLGI